jgi:hypothetical protein
MARSAETVSLADAARVFSCSQETVRRWRKAGMPCRMDGDRPRFVLAECIRWRLEVVEEAARAALAPPSEAAERLGKLRAERQLRELELDRQRGLVMPTAATEEALETFVAGFAAVAAGQLARFEREIIEAVTPAAARVITTRIHEALMQGAQGYAEELETPVAPDEAAA